MSGAVDLSALKARAEAKAAQQARPAPAPDAEGAPSSPESGAAVADVTDQSFTAEVIEASAKQLVVVALTAAYSEQSAALSAVLEKLAADDGGRWKFARVDVDAAPGVAQAFGAQSVPMVIAVAGGRAATAFAGAQPEPVVRQWLDDVLSQLGPVFGDDAAGAAGAAEPPSDPRREAAEQLAADGDYAGARAAYEAILHADPRDAEAAAAVKQMAFFARATVTEPGAIERAAAAPGDVDAALAAADEELLTGNPAGAFARLISAIRTTAGDDRAALRTRLIELFDLFDPADAVVLAARRELAKALF